MNELVENVHDDLLMMQDVFGSEFIYEKSGDDLIAVQMNQDGDPIARYKVKVSLEKL